MFSSMQLVKMRFDRVFDIQPVRQGVEARTIFSFEGDGRRHYAVTVPGKPDIRNGQHVLAVLHQENNWQTLRGWKDLDTGDVAFNGPWWPLSVVLMYLPIKLALLAGVLRDNGVWWYVGLIPFLCFDVMLLRDAWDRVRVKALLKQG